MAEPKFARADIDRWVSQGTITPAQSDAILRDLEKHAGSAGAGIDLTTLLYYGGGLLVLLAYGIFLGLQWKDLASGARIAISGASFVAFTGISSILLRSDRYRLPGELLQVAAVAAVPLLAFALMDAAGWWPQEPGYDQAWKTYQEELAWARIGLATPTLIAAAAAFRLSRSPYVLIAAIVALGSLLVDVSNLASYERAYYEWGTAQSLTIASLGAALLAAGYLVRGIRERDYTTWLYLTGLAGLAVGLGTKAFPSNDPVWGALWMIVALCILALSIPLQQRLFAMAGLVAVFAYLGKLVFDVFESAYAALVLALLGLVILGAGMVYQRYHERLFGAGRASARKAS